MPMPGRIASPRGWLWLVPLARLVRGSGGIAPGVLCKGVWGHSPQCPCFILLSDRGRELHLPPSPIVR